MGTKKDNKNWLEWTVTGVSAIIVLFTLSFLVYQWIMEEQTPPDILVTFGNTEIKQNYYAISVIAENKGAKTAQKVRIEISTGSEINAEKAHIEFDYIPGKSSVKGWVSFNQNPQSKKLKTHVLGYVTP